MSTPASPDGNGDVNDVLSSIRKLVSEEARARARVEQAQAKGSPEPASSPAPLVLNPTQEVVSAPEPLVLNEPARAPEPEAVSNVTEPVVEDVGEAPFQDEVALRKLVSEIIKEELQGELGERITRNVRKLIQHEIAASMKAKS